ncbi:ABC transporter permease [Microbacterium sp. 13-71-7]|jgi:putative ABC transport system permease protein|uniref:ABC transporter permease n=1 Tax=Microbacterium sp. 13-71-7 TaxID=1970399 RepID=UPI000BD1C5BE|nr:ABC transporter permease [Microbacterium sp. 13-71-7]OZB83279.1 MAG: permease [Microbacterium sp. 13-71-7]
MKTLDLVRTAISSTFRSKTRTTLTILAIFVGAFTLTITNGLGTGINKYIDDTVSGFGASDVLTVTKKVDAGTTPGSTAPREYDPNTATTGGGREGATTVAVLTQSDLDALAKVNGVTAVKPVRAVSVDYVQFDDGKRYMISTGGLVAGQTVKLAAGVAPSDATGDLQLALPTDFVTPLGFSSAADAVGKTVTLAVTDATRTQHTIEATVSGVSESTFSLTGGAASMLPNDALTGALYAAQQTGVQAGQQNRYTQARAWFDASDSPAQVKSLQDRLASAGYSSTTVAQQLGTFKAVIDGIVLVLNAFAIIALLAASFGIINTLYMSVQERTREIGLMKAMGMGSGRVFGLFSLEATFIGFLGSALGVLGGMLVGSVVSRILGRTLLSDLSGLQLVAFDARSIASVILLVMVIAFLAGTLPAARAARQDPVESLRYE